MMDNTKNPPASRRTRHSYREAIRRVILERIALGKPLNQRQIREEAGGGSASTIVEELANAQRPTPATLVGAGAKSLPQRVAALEDALNASVAREKSLQAENQVLKDSLTQARSDLDKLLVSHQDSQRMLLQGVDDLRQMVKAGQGTMIKEIVEKATPADNNSGEALLWQARHDQLLKRFIALDETKRRYAAQLHDLGVDAD